jgi:putative transcriptional regulator
MNTISHIRARLGVTQTAMAEGLGVSQGNISNYERGQAMPPHVAARLIAYAASLGVALTYDEIYAAEEPMRSPTPNRRSTDPKPEPGRAGRNPPSRKNVASFAGELNQPFERKT